MIRGTYRLGLLWVAGEHMQLEPIS